MFDRLLDIAEAASIILAGLFVCVLLAEALAALP